MCQHLSACSCRRGSWISPVCTGLIWQKDSRFWPGFQAPAPSDSGAGPGLAPCRLGSEKRSRPGKYFKPSATMRSLLTCLPNRVLHVPSGSGESRDGVTKGATALSRRVSSKPRAARSLSSRDSVLSVFTQGIGRGAGKMSGILIPDSKGEEGARGGGSRMGGRSSRTSNPSGRRRGPARLAVDPKWGS